MMHEMNPEGMDEIFKKMTSHNNKQREFDEMNEMNFRELPL